jgi:tetratricopeptide (TPR) repeat protein
VLIAESVGYDRATARGLIALVDVRGRGQVRPADGLALVPRAQAVVTRIGGEPALAATLDTYRGRILLILGKYDEALAILRAVADARRALDPRHPEVASAEIDVADALQKLGRPAEALPHYQAALALRRELFGADHVLVARAVYSLGNGYVELGDYDRALASYQAALDAYQATFGPNHAMLAAALNNLGYANNLAGAAGRRGAAPRARPRDRRRHRSRPHQPRAPRGQPRRRPAPPRAARPGRGAARAVAGELPRRLRPRQPAGDLVGHRSRRAARRPR